MDRRHFLTAQRKRPSAIAPAPFRTQSGLNPYNGAWTVNEVQHLLKRTMFGSAKNDIDYFKKKTLSQIVNELLNPTAALPAPPVNNYNSGTVTDPAVQPGQTWINNPINDGAINSARRSSFKQWWAGVMINQDRSLREKMTLFWANHFGTETVTIGNANYVYGHHTLLRENALGNFKQLVRKVTTDAGMLIYLNGYLNTTGAPDENYGRELQELFTIGKGPNSHYTEADVKAAAKVSTGWRINGTTFSVYFDPAKHDTTNKQFSPFYNSTIIAGKSGAAASTEIDDLINMIFANSETASFICRKLYRWFVYYNIDDTTEANVIQPLATIMRQNNYDIKPVLSALFKSEHFFDVLNQGCCIKSPVDHVIACLREYGVKFPDASTQYADAYGMWNYIFNWMANMNQNIGDPPNVSGWVAYYQAPQFHEIWINSDTLPKRNQFTDTMILSGYTRSGKKIMIDAIEFTKTLSNPSDPNALLNEVLSIIYRVPLADDTKQTIKQQLLLSGQVNDAYWTGAWNNYLAAPDDTSAYTIVNNRLKSLYQYLMNLAEYQLA